MLERICSFVVVALLLTSNVTGDIGDDSTVLARSEEWVIEFQGFVPCEECPYQKVLELRVVHEEGEVFLVRLDEELREVGEKDIKVSVQGQYGILVAPRQHGEVVLLFELDPKRGFIVRASHLSRASALSPDGLRVAYANWSLRFVRETHTLVLSIAEISDSGIQDRVVYPVSHAEDQNPKPWERIAARRLTAVSPFFWGDDGSRLLFFERQGERGPFYSVMLELEDRPMPLMRRRREISVDGLLRKGIAPPHRVGFYVETVKWRDREHVLIVEGSLSDQAYWRTEKVRVAFPSHEAETAVTE